MQHKRRRKKESKVQ